MKIKTTELEGAALDWAVAKAIGKEVIIRPVFGVMTPDTMGWRPSTDWSQGGPLIEKFDVVFRHHADGQMEAACMTGEIGLNRKRSKPMKGSNYLIAACLAIVATKLGDKVNIPDDLCKEMAEND